MAYATRTEAENAKDTMDMQEIEGVTMKIGWGKGISRALVEGPRIVSTVVGGMPRNYYYTYSLVLCDAW